MNAPTNHKDFLDPIKEAKAVAALREAYGVDDEDERFLSDVIEGETSLYEVMDLMLTRIRDAEIVIAGIDAVSSDLDLRKKRHADSIKRDRALIEQAMTIGDLTKIVRPTATLSLRINPPSVTVIEEADIPTDFFVRGEPKLDKKALNAAVLAHAAAMAIEDPEARAAALAEAPEIAGVTLSNGAPSVTIRNK